MRKPSNEQVQLQLDQPTTVWNNQARDYELVTGQFSVALPNQEAADLFMSTVRSVLEDCAYNVSEPAYGLVDTEGTRVLVPYGQRPEPNQKRRWPKVLVGAVAVLAFVGSCSVAVEKFSGNDNEASSSTFTPENQDQNDQKGDEDLLEKLRGDSTQDDTTLEVTPPSLSATPSPAPTQTATTAPSATVAPSKTATPNVPAAIGKPFTVMTFNLLGHSHTERGGKAAELASGPSRMAHAVKYIVERQAAVVGLQEVQSPQRQAFKRYAPSYLKMVVPPNEPRPENPIVYDSRVFQLKDVDSVPIRYFDGQKRLVPAVELQQYLPGDKVNQATGKFATFFNTHNPANTRAYGNQKKWRNLDMANQSQYFKSQVKLGKRVIALGDFNDNKYVHSYYKDVMDTLVKPDTLIDIIFGSKGTVGLANLNVDRSLKAKGITDHPVVTTQATLR